MTALGSAFALSPPGFWLWRGWRIGAGRFGGVFGVEFELFFKLGDTDHSP